MFRGILPLKKLIKVKIQSKKFIAFDNSIVGKGLCRALSRARRELKENLAATSVLLHVKSHLDLDLLYRCFAFE